ncbi:hypothetical protein [Clostridium tetani]
MRGVVNSSNIAIKLDNYETEVKDKLNQLYDIVIGEFRLIKKADITWEQKRNSFLQEIIRINQDRGNKISVQDMKPPISAEVIELLKVAIKDSTGEILKNMDLSGTQIQAGKTVMNKKENHRDIALWESILNELISIKLIKQVDKKGEVFKVTNLGYKTLE